ncbi:MAG: hypothetical protein CMM23_16455 [Rhodospirillaceae bacterium]|jgi:alkylation response protein AidB-like acyl-CoA dehydrogenase|nr:hypothetical protein [Rhodospirillaceae bacterium]
MVAISATMGMDFPLVSTIKIPAQDGIAVADKAKHSRDVDLNSGKIRPIPLDPYLDADEIIRNQETLEQTLAAITRFVRERLAPHEEQVDREGRISEEIVNEMRALGLAGLTLQEEFVGAGLTIEDKISVTMTMARPRPRLTASWRRMQFQATSWLHRAARNNGAPGLITWPRARSQLSSP